MTNSFTYLSTTDQSLTLQFSTDPQISRKCETSAVDKENECVYYESRKRELKRRLINEGLCDERLKGKVEESTCLSYTGLNDKTN
jgi:hypothetical protein